MAGLNIDQILRLSDLYSLTRVNMANARSAFQVPRPPAPSLRPLASLSRLCLGLSRRCLPPLAYTIAY